MKFYQDTTDYNGIKSGIYLLDNSKSLMYAYIAPKSTTVKEFKKPIRIDSRGRTFEEVKNTFKFTIKKEENRVVKEVIGSKGNKYIIEESENGLICGCPGFKFRGKCKHI